ncbi:DUF6286 domain-containing protein [Streptomyces sp. adm13(2018)]|uniref:DUF6286 domain-containing protein n=1 Tax=Streptomyces sp. adm13(2018) TaxID=2479007 RepID=UPI00164FE311|nr:DUF6286 domain-containing protein [Streptomyces sp. adm13(2018)]
MTARLRGHSAHLRLDVRLHRPDSLAETVEGLQEHVARRTGELTGLPCEGPWIRVTRLTLPAPRTPAITEAGAEGTPPTTRHPRRCWSQRRGPVAVLSLIGSLLLGALALDIAGFRSHGRPLAAWWSTGVAYAADHGSGTLLPTVTAGLTAGLAVLLILLALLPGHRRRWTVSSGPALTSSVDRKVIEDLLRDAVGAVEGTGPVAVRMSRRTATVRATLMFGDREAALAEAQSAADRAMAACRLVRPPRLRVIVGALAHPAVQTNQDPDPDPGIDPAEPGIDDPRPELGPGHVPGPDLPRRSESDRAPFSAPRRPKDDSPITTSRQGADS